MILQNGCNLNWLQPVLIIFCGQCWKHWPLRWYGTFLTAPFSSLQFQICRRAFLPSPSGFYTLQIPASCQARQAALDSGDRHACITVIDHISHADPTPRSLPAADCADAGFPLHATPHPNLFGAGSIIIMAEAKEQIKKKADNTICSPSIAVRHAGISKMKQQAMHMPAYFFEKRSCPLHDSSDVERNASARRTIRPEKARKNIS